MNEIDINRIQEILSNQITFKGNKTFTFNGIQAAQEAEEGYMTWIKPGGKYEKELVNSVEATGIICKESTLELFEGDLKNKLFILTDKPKYVFVKLLKEISENEHGKFEGIHPTAIIDPKCELGMNVSIGAFSIIGACKIGTNTKIYNNVRIYDPVTIGENCIVREYCSIGGEGCGVQKELNNENLHIPHIGYVKIEDNVQIFPYCNIDRGNLGMTKVGYGSFLDHYVYVSHNSSIGKNNIIAGRTTFCGGSSVQDNCFLGVNTLIKEKVKLGSNILTGLGSVIIKDIPSDEVWAGNPAKFIKKTKNET